MSLPPAVQWVYDCSRSRVLPKKSSTPIFSSSASGPDGIAYLQMEHLVTQYAVMGDPISHSKSSDPSLFAEQTGEDMHYDKFQIAAADFPAEVAVFERDGGGLNVTVPHKEAAFALADYPSPRASLARAANTLGRDPQGGIWADNTDESVWCRPHDNHQLSLSVSIS